MNYSSNIYNIDASTEFFEAISGLEALSIECAMESLFTNATTSNLRSFLKTIEGLMSSIGRWSHDQSVAVNDCMKRVFSSNKNRMKELTMQIKSVTTDLKVSRRIMNNPSLPQDMREHNRMLYTNALENLAMMNEELESLHEILHISVEHDKLLTAGLKQSFQLKEHILGFYKGYKDTCDAQDNPKNKRYPIKTQDVIKSFRSVTSKMQESSSRKQIYDFDHSIPEIYDKICNLPIQSMDNIEAYPITNFFAMQMELKYMKITADFLLQRCKEIRENVNQMARNPALVQSSLQMDAMTSEITLIANVIQLWSSYFSYYLKLYLTVPQANLAMLSIKKEG